MLTTVVRGTFRGYAKVAYGLFLVSLSDASAMKIIIGSWLRPSSRNAANKLSSIKPQRAVRVGLVAALAVTVLMLGSAPARADDIELDGTFGYSINSTKLTFDLGKIANNRNGGTSGSLRVELWATSSPYTGGTINGYILGTKDLGILKGGYYFRAKSTSVTYKSPPSGTYYVTLTLEEYSSSGFVIVDYVNFSGAKTFSQGMGSSSTDLKLEGPSSWSRSGSKLTIKVAKVINASSGGTSGSLRLKVWATTSSYSGGTITGRVLGYVSLKKLAAGYQYTDINKTVSFKKPPNGTYYTTLTLEEYLKGKYIIKDFIPMSGTTTFGTSSTTPGSGVKSDWFNMNPNGYDKNVMTMLRNLGLASGPTGGRGYQLWSYCATAMSYYNVYASNPTSANWSYHVTCAELAYQFYLKAPYD